MNTPDQPLLSEQHEASRRQNIQRLNDLFRTTFIGGKVILTSGVQNLGQDACNKLFQRIHEFNEFTPDNDPHGEHDFGSLEHDGHKIFWKIDYYDKALEFGSEDPSDPTQTTRVLTVMLAEEY